MFFVPIIERELRRASRKGTKSRFRVALLGAAAVVLFLGIFAASDEPRWGRELHGFFFWAGLYLAVTPPMRISIGLFSEERRNQTLELIFLTGITPGELFLGKLLGGTLTASAALLALAPLLAVPFLSGGISLQLYLATLGCLPVLFLFALAVGVLASVLFRDEGAAFIFAVVLAGCLCFAVPIPYYFGTVLSGSPPFSAKWLCLSPAYPPYLVYTKFGVGGIWQFWTASLMTLAWTAALLALAALLLRNNWRAEVRGVIPSGWQRRLNAWVRRAGPRPTSSKSGVLEPIPAGGIALIPPRLGEDTTPYRERLLMENPFAWLAQRDRRPLLLGYATIGPICLLWLLGWWAWPRAWPSTANFFITAMVLLAVVRWLILFAAARRMGTDRREGMLELLLTTPATPQEMVDGELAGVLRQFRPLQYVVLCLLILLMLSGFMMRSWNTLAAITYALVWCALGGWCLAVPRGRMLKVMWAALNTCRPVYSVFKSHGNKWTWLWILYNLRTVLKGGLAGGAAGFPSGSVFEFTVVCVIGAGAGLIYLTTNAFEHEAEPSTKKRLVREMRLIATEPIPDPNDPSFEGWEGIQRLRDPAGSGHSQGDWPPFADPEARLRVRARTPQAWSWSAVVLEDTLELLRLLHEQQVSYAVAGGLATDLHLGSRTTQDAHLLMPASALERVPELQIGERTSRFCWAQFRGIEVTVYFTEEPFFEAIQLQFTKSFPLDSMAVPTVTVEGLIALDLYAIDSLTRQREFYRLARYEENIIALLTRHNVRFEPILALVQPHVPEQYIEELEETLKSCKRLARRWRGSFQASALECAR